MISINHTLTGNSTHLKDLFRNEKVSFVAIANLTNTNGTVYIGGDNPVFPIAAETDRIFPVKNLQNAYIKGTVGNVIQIIVGS